MDATHLHVLQEFGIACSGAQLQVMHESPHRLPLQSELLNELVTKVAICRAGICLLS